MEGGFNTIVVLLVVVGLASWVGLNVNALSGVIVGSLALVSAYALATTS